MSGRRGLKSTRFVRVRVDLTILLSREVDSLPFDGALSDLAHTITKGTFGVACETLREEHKTALVMIPGSQVQLSLDHRFTEKLKRALAEQNRAGDTDGEEKEAT